MKKMRRRTRKRRRKRKKLKEVSEKKEEEDKGETMVIGGKTNSRSRRTLQERAMERGSKGEELEKEDGEATRKV